MKKNEGVRRLVEVLDSNLDRYKSIAWLSIIEKACQGIRRQKDIRDRFEMIEQEKGVLEEEFGDALTLNEDLQVQYE